MKRSFDMMRIVHFQTCHVVHDEGGCACTFSVNRAPKYHAFFMFSMFTIDHLV